MFPQIHHIDDVLPAIQGREEFYISEKPGYKVINYRNPLSDTFDLSENGKIRSECRGIIFDDFGKLIRRPLHKFHNIGEKDWIRPENIDLSEQHAIMQKLDGTMIAPFMVKGRIIWGTKLGETDFSPIVEEYVKNSPYFYIDIVENILRNNMTPIFEWTSPSNRIVVNYKEDALTLLAIRENIHGSYINFKKDQMLGIPLVQEYDTFGQDINQIISRTRSLKNEEGYVVRFNDGSMFKIKADDYIRMHKAKDSIALEKNVLELIFNDQLDDILTLLSEDDKRRILDYNDKVIHAFNQNVMFYHDALNVRLMTFKIKKEYALSAACSYDKKNKPFLPGLVFKYMNEGEKVFVDVLNVHDDMLDFVKKNLTSSTKVEQVVKPLINNHSWNYALSEE